MYKGISRTFNENEGQFLTKDSNGILTERSLSRGSELIDQISTVLQVHHEGFNKELQYWAWRQEELLGRFFKRIEAPGKCPDIPVEGDGCAGWLSASSCPEPKLQEHALTGLAAKNGTSSSSVVSFKKSETNETVETKVESNSSKGSRSDAGPIRSSVTERIHRVRDVAGISVFDGHASQKRKSELVLFQTSTVQTFRFEGFCAVVIFVNSILIAAETEMKAQGNDTPNSWIIAGHVFNSWFCAEMVIRMFTSGLRQYFCSPDDRGWNMFDMLLVTVWLVDLTIGRFPYDEARGILRILKLLRVLRTLRIFRFVREVREFRKMIFAIMNTINTLMWSLLLLVFEIFFFSIVFIQAVNNVRDNERDVELKDLTMYFGSFARAYYSLFRSITSGISWGDVMEPLLLLSPRWLYAGMFCIFISVTLFGIMNVLTAVFVESAMSSTQHNRELLVDEKEGVKRMYMSHIKEIFKTIDDDGSGEIQIEEIEQIFQDPSMSRLLEALEIDAYDAHSMFKLLDVDDSGAIDIDEFCEGCLRLKGEAKSFDIQCLMYENQRIATKTRALMVCCEESFGELRQLLRNQVVQTNSKFASLTMDVGSLNKDIVTLGSTVSGLRRMSSCQLSPRKHTQLYIAPLSLREETAASVSDLNGIDMKFEKGPEPIPWEFTSESHSARSDETAVQPPFPLLQARHDLKWKAPEPPEDQPIEMIDASHKRLFGANLGPACSLPRRAITDGIYSL